MVNQNTTRPVLARIDELGKLYHKRANSMCIWRKTRIDCSVTVAAKVRSRFVEIVVAKEAYSFSCLFYHLSQDFQIFERIVAIAAVGSQLVEHVVATAVVRSRFVEHVVTVTIAS